MKFEITSSNFSWHEPRYAETYEDALAIAKERGFEAEIRRNQSGSIVATYSPLYGVHVYDRALT